MQAVSFNMQKIHKYVIALIALLFVTGIIFSKSIKIFAIGEPTSIAYISADSELGDNGWYTSAVSVTIEGTSSDVTSLTYWLNAGQPSTATGDLTTQTFAQNGQNTLYYFATDSNGVRELTTNQISFKVDTVAPRNWRLFNATQNGNNHTFNFNISVDDAASGIANNNAQIQYSTDGGDSFGFNTPTTSCNNFSNNGWITLSGQSFSNGANTAQLLTPTIDVCNSNWDVCKIIRFKVEDLAGNESEKKVCLFGAWMQAVSGNIHSLGNISMNTTGAEDNNDGIIFSEGSISNFTSVGGYRSTPYQNGGFEDLRFANLGAKYIPTSSALPSGRLPTQSGFYYINGNLSVTSTTIPSGFSSAKDFAAIILINGNLTINTNITTDNSSVIMFVLNGNVDVNRSVNNIDAIFISDGTFDTSYNGTSNNQLTMRGGIWTGGGIEFSRSLSNSANNTTPAEKIIFPSSIFLNQSLSNLLVGSNRFVWREVIE